MIPVHPYLLIAAALVLAGSITGNVALFNAWQGAETRATTAETNLTNANTATETCNASITGLETAAFKRGQVAGKAREAARQKALELEKQAQNELSTPATVPGDDCRSAQDRVTRVLGERSKP